MFVGQAIQTRVATMHTQVIPRFGRVRFSNAHGLSGVGTTIWFDREYKSHVVALGDQYRCLREHDLTFTGATVPEAWFLGQRNEISFDVEEREGRRYDEGCLRRPGRFWECFFVRPVAWQEGTPWLPRIETTGWRSGITGHLVEVGHGFECTNATVSELLAELLHVETFDMVHGPDSLWLK